MSYTDDTQYAAMLDMRAVFNGQVQRCLAASGTEYFGTTVLSLRTLLPNEARHLLIEQEEMYTNYDPRYIFTTYQGWDIGTKEEPMLRDDSKPVRRLENGSIDWNDPNIFSPRLNTDPPPIDYDRLFEMIIEEAEHRGLLWDTVATAVELRVRG